jgi:glucose-6-phosphate 1-epimerase
VQTALEPNESIRSLWSPDFRLDYTVRLTAQTLETRLTVTNTGSEPLRFQALLHNYISVPVGEASVGPLAEREYIDKPDGAKVKRETNEWVRWKDETDRVYRSTDSQLTVKSDTRGPVLKVVKSELPDTVVWNPGQAKGEAIGDMEQGGWQVFLQSRQRKWKLIIDSVGQGAFCMCGARPHRLCRAVCW